MGTHLSSRRRLLQMGAIGVSTSIAGCAFNQPDDIGRDYDEDRRNKDDKPDGDQFQRPAEAPATFQSTKRADFSYHELPFQRELPEDPSDMDYDGRGHPDNTLIHIEIENKSTATATIRNVNVTRDIELTLHVRDKNGAFQTTHNTLTATEEDTHTTCGVEFNLLGIDLPTGAGSICDLTGKDTHSGDDFTMLFKRHQFVGIPYKNGVNWVNNENFNYTRWVDANGQAQWSTPKGVKGNSRAEPAGHVEHIDDGDERIVFLATRNTVNSEVFGVSCHIPHEPYNKYVNGSDRYQYRHDMSYESHFATDISYLRELASKTDAAITDIGISNPRERIEALGDLIQAIPYKAQDEAGPTVVLYEQAGDCSEKSGVLSGILQNNPWNMMPAYIDCRISGVRHWTIGIDVNDLGNYNADNNFTVAPSNSQVSNGYPDTEFAFFDMTYDSQIGERTSGLEGDVTIYDLGDFSYNPGRRSNDRPTY